MSDNTWTESTINHSNAPAPASSWGSSGAFSANAWTTVDVTEYITGNGTYNLAFSTGSTTNVSYSSREGANAPQLVIETSTGPTNTPTATATAGPSPTPTSTSLATPTKTATPTATNTSTTPQPPTPTAPPPFQNASFVYDGDGKRVKSTFNGMITTYFIGAHFELTGSTVTKYYYAGAQRIAMRTGSWDYNNPVTGTLNFILGDHLGSTSLTTDGAGNKVSELHYKAWGEVRYASGNTPTKYTFTGQFSYVNDFGLMFYNARWLDVSLGRFAQADTIIPEQTQGVQAWDRYAYTNNNPIRYIDPSGHSVDCAIGEPNCSAGKLVPEWWNRRNHIYVEGYGYFDTGHIRRGWDAAQWFAQETMATLAQGGGTFQHPATSGSNYEVYYSISTHVTEDQMLGVLYGMYTDFERGYEEHQAWNTFGFISSFAPEDLPSDHLGFWAYMNGLDQEEIPSLLESLGEVTDLGGSPLGMLVIDTFTHGTHVGITFPRNFEFLPMVTDLIQYGSSASGTQTKNVALPSWLEIEPIQSGPNTWQRVE